MLLPGIVDSDKRGSALDVVGAYSPCDSLETAYVADNGFTTYAGGVWTAVQSEHVAGLAVRSGDYLATRTEDVAILLGISVQNFVGDALLYVSIYDTGTGTYVGTGIGETIPEAETVFVRMLSAGMYGKLRVRIDIIGDTIAFDSITLHGIYTYDCQPAEECDQYWDDVVLAMHMDENPDPYWDNVVLAMKMDGANGSTTFIDEKGRTVSRPNTGEITTEKSKFGGSCLKLFNSYASWISSTSTDYTIGTADFTVEAFVYLTGYAGDKRLFNPAAGGYFVAEITNVTGKLAATGITGLGTAVPLNEWVHVAFCRVSGVLKAFINGVQQWSAAYTQNLSASEVWLAFNAGSNGFYVDDLRVTKGVARYTANFTPPTAAINPAFLDEKGHTVTSYGNAQISSAQSMFGDASAYFDGSGDYLSIPNNADFSFGAGDFTISYWVRITASAAYTFLDFRSTTSGAAGTRNINTGTTSGGKVVFYAASTANAYVVTLTDPDVLTLNVWHNIAHVRSGNSFYLFVDGAIKDSGSSSATLMAPISPLLIGRSAGPGYYDLVGNVDEVRIWKDAAKWTTAFTPPTAPFADTGCGTIQTAATIGWSIGDAIDTSADIGWTVAWAEEYAFDKSAALGWSIASDIDRSASIGWALQTNANALAKSVNTLWSVAQPIDKAIDIRWGIVPQMDKSVLITWAIQ